MKKYDLIKMTGWIAVAIGGLVASWATDKVTPSHTTLQPNRPPRQ